LPKKRKARWLPRGEAGNEIEEVKRRGRGDQISQCDVSWCGAENNESVVASAEEERAEHLSEVEGVATAPLEHLSNIVRQVREKKKKMMSNEKSMRPARVRASKKAAKQDLQAARNVNSWPRIQLPLQDRKPARYLCFL